MKEKEKKRKKKKWKGGRGERKEKFSLSILFPSMRNGEKKTRERGKGGP